MNPGDLLGGIKKGHLGEVSFGIATFLAGSFFIFKKINAVPRLVIVRVPIDSDQGAFFSSNLLKGTLKGLTRPLRAL